MTGRMTEGRLAEYRRVVEVELGKASMLRIEPHPGYKMTRFCLNEIDRLTAENERLRAEKDGAYHERNQVVAALAKLFPSGVATDPNEPDWPLLFIDLPDGQVSWHFQRSEAAELLLGIPKYEGEWDGHTTEEKYTRLKALAALRAEAAE